MRSLQGHISATESQRVAEAVRLRFSDTFVFKTAEALIVYEQRMIPVEELHKYCEEEYGRVLEEPKINYLPQAVVDAFSSSHFIPFKLDSVAETLHVMTLPEFEAEVHPQYGHYQIAIHIVPIYYFINNFIRLYSVPEFLYPLPAKDYFDFIVEEATNLDASDITISKQAKTVAVYYKVRQKKVRSKRMLPNVMMDDVVSYVASKAHSSFATDDSSPKHMGMDLDLHHRGRVVINTTYYGKSISIRVLPNALFEQTMSDLNILEKDQNFIMNRMLSNENGLRLLIGGTSSGKNTTIVAMLKLLVDTDRYKIVSVEQPVELLVDGIEQINAETDELFAENVQSLIRQNPDRVYITEITDSTALATIEVANTAKPVFSSVHAPSISDVVARLMDLTHLSSDRIVMCIHSCIYQELVRDEDRDIVLPKMRCLYFSEELKSSLFGKSIGEVHNILKKEEDKWC